MKALKKLIFLTLIASLLLSMCSCSIPFLDKFLGGILGGDIPGVDNPTEENNDQYKPAADKINQLIYREQSYLELEICTEKNGVELFSRYWLDTSLDEAQVRYSIQKLGTYRTEDGVMIPPESFIVTETGVGELMQGRLISLDGQPVNLPYVDALKAKFFIDVNSCYNFQYEEDHFFAFDCENPAQLLGCEVDTTSVRMNVEYTAEAITWMNLSYATSDGTNVSLHYQFYRQ